MTTQAKITTSTESIPVTVDNSVRAETDRTFDSYHLPCFRTHRNPSSRYHGVLNRKRLATLLVGLSNVLLTILT